MSHMSELDAAGISVKQMADHLKAGGTFGEGLKSLRKKTYAVTGDGCTCGHRHKSMGAAADCLDRLTDATILCQHGKLTIPNHHFCPHGCTEPRDASGKWDRTEIGER